MEKLNMKKCSKCKKSEPETTFYSDQGYCKPCMKAYNKARQKRCYVPRPRKSLIKPPKIECSYCHVIKDTKENFYKGRTCHDCIKLKARIKYQNVIKPRKQRLKEQNKEAIIKP